MERGDAAGQPDCPIIFIDFKLKLRIQFPCKFKIDFRLLSAPVQPQYTVIG